MMSITDLSRENHHEEKKSLFHEQNQVRLDMER